MKHPLILPVALLALLILLGEQFFGCFSRWCNPARNADHYCHYVVNDNNWHDATFFLAKITSLPSKRAKTYRFEAEVIEITDTNSITHPCIGKIIIYLPYSDSLSAFVTFGDTLLALASPQIPPSADSINHFDYRRYIFRKGILRTAYVPAGQFRIVGHDNSSFTAHISNIRQRLLKTIRFSQLTPSQQGIAEALFLGWNDDLDPETKQNFRSAGISHLLCVSGLHVGIVAFAIGWCLSFLGNRRRSRIIRGILQLTVVWLFVLLTQMAPATLRAAIMFSFIIVGQMFFSKPSTLNSIAISALLLLIINPLLMFDMGFQFSYTSVTAIVLFVRPLEAILPLPETRLSDKKLLLSSLRKIRSLFCVSVVAQLALAPFMLFYFHSFATYFLIANMVVIPFAGVLLCGVIVMVLIAWWPWAFMAVGKVVSLILHAVEWLTATIASWPHALIEDIRFDRWTLLMSMLIVALLGRALLRRRWQPIAIALVVAIIQTVYTQIAL